MKIPKIPKILSAEDFPNKPYVNGAIPPTMDNFNTLLKSYNNLSEIVTFLARKNYIRLDKNE